MVNQERINNWTVQHFFVYLFLCIAYSDFQIDEDEYEEIKLKLSEKSSLSDEEFEHVYQEVLHEFRHHKDSEKTQLIEQQCGKFIKSEQEKNEVLEELKDLIKSDGRVESLEMMTYRFIKKILHTI